MQPLIPFANSFLIFQLATIKVLYLPLFAFNITSNVFITPPSSNLFPILPSDVARLQGFLHSKVSQIRNFCCQNYWSARIFSISELRGVHKGACVATLLGTLLEVQDHTKVKFPVQDNSSLAVKRLSAGVPGPRSQVYKTIQNFMSRMWLPTLSYGNVFNFKNVFFCHFKGDKRIFNHLGDVDFNFLPHNIQSNIKVFINYFLQCLFSVILKNLYFRVFNLWIFVSLFLNHKFIFCLFRYWRPH